MKKTLAIILSLCMMLSLLPMSTLAEGEPVAEIGSTKYDTLQEALDYAVTGDTVTLLQDIEETVKIPDGKEIVLDMNGKTLTGDGTASVIEVGASTKLTLTGNGTITTADSAASAPERGGGIWLPQDNGAELVMESGTITGNTATKYGGGVYVGKGCTFTMNGGAITDNTTTGSDSIGGGVHSVGSFIMKDGEISANVCGGTKDDGSIGGGGVSTTTTAGSSFEMKGGTIQNNTALNGAGVLVKGAVTLSGGTITGNKADALGSGVYVWKGSGAGNLTVSGQAKVTGNTGDNIYLFTGLNINVSGTLAAAASFGVTLQAARKGAFTTGLSASGGQATNFVADVDGQKVLPTAAGEAALGFAITVDDTAEGCDSLTTDKDTDGAAIYGETVTVTAEPAASYALDEITITGASGTEYTAASDGTFTMPAEDVTVSATFVKNAFTVTFDLGEGSAPEGAGDDYAADQTVSSGETAVEPTPAPVLTGNEFDGWYVGDATEKFDFATPITEDTDLTAKFTPKEIIVTLHSDTTYGGWQSGDHTLRTPKWNYGETGTLPKDPTPEAGYEFLGYFTEAEAGEKMEKADILATAVDLELWAHYGLLPAVEPAVAVTPETTEATVGSVEATLTAAVTPDSGTTYGTPTYQWYTADSAEAETGTAIDGATAETYVVPTDSAVGTYYYYCEATVAREDNGETATGKSSVVTVTVTTKSIAEAVITVSEEPVYDGTAKTPAFIVEDNGVELTEDDYELVGYENNTNAGDSAKVTIKGKGNYDPDTTAEGTFTIAPKSIADATVMVSGGTKAYNGGAELAPDAISVKDGTTDLVEGTDYTVSYKDSTGAAVTGLPSNQDVYTIVIAGLGNYTDTNETQKFTITGQAAVITSDPEALTLTYTGEEQALFTAGEAEGGSFQFRLFGVDGAEWTSEVPTGKDAGDYKYEYRFHAAENYSAPAGHESTLTATIAPAPLQLTWTDADPLVYDGTSKDATAAATGLGSDDLSGMTFSYAYSKDGGNADPINAGDYTVTAIGVASGANANYTLTGAATAVHNFTIEKADAPVASVTAKELEYTGEAQALFEKGTLPTGLSVIFHLKGNDEVIYEPTQTEAGEYEYEFMVRDDSTAKNYKDSEWTPITGVIAKKAVELTWGETEFTYDGTAHYPTVTATGIGGASVEVSAEDSAQTDAGTYTAYAVLADTEVNYRLPDEATVEFTIKPAEITIEWTDTSFTYDGTEHAPTATPSGVVGTDDLGLTVSGGQTDAGENYPATAEITNTNYVIKEGDEETTFTIAPAEITIAWTHTDDLVYTGTEQAPTATPDGVIGSDDLGLTVSGGQTDAGEDYPATAEITNTNYVIKEGDEATTFAIAPAPITITWSDTELNYNATEQGPTATPSGMVNGETADDLELTVSGKQTNANAEGETYTATAEIGNGNYVIETGETTEFTIAPAELKVKVQNATKSYGDADPTFGWQITSGELFGDDSISGSLTRDPGEDVTETGYVISGAALTAGPNYTLYVQNGILKIVPLVAVLEWADDALTYSGEPQKPTATVANLKDGDTCDVTVSGEQTDANAEGETYTAEATELSNPNYTLPTDGTEKHAFTISPLTAELEWDTTGLVYDGTAKLPTATVSNLIGEDACDVTVETADGTDAINAGDYTAKATALSNSNYALPEEATQAFTIEQLEAELSWTHTDDLIYNGTPQKPEAEVSNAVEGDEFTIVVTGEETNANAEGETYTATVTDLGNANYKLPEDPTTTFTIAPKDIANVTIADIEAMTYNAEQLKPTPAVTDPEIGEGGTALVADTDFEYVYGENYHAGTGTVSLTGKGNYTGTTAEVSFTIDKFVVTDASQLKWGDLELVYIGAAQYPEALLVNVPDGQLNLIVGAHPDYSDEDPTDVATGYHASASGIAEGQKNADGNDVDINDYVLNGPAIATEFNIVPAPLTVTPTAGQTKVYGDADPEFTYDADYLVGKDVDTGLSGKLARAEGEDVADNYAYTIGTLQEENPNYAITLVDDQEFFSITKADLTITADDFAKTYGEDDPTPLTASASGLKNGDSLSGVPVRAAGEDADAYEIDPEGSVTVKNGTQDKMANYNITYVKGTFTINPKAVSPIIDTASPLTYTGTAQKPNVFVKASDIVGDDTVGVTFKITETEGGEEVEAINAGTYYAEVTGLDNPNYVLASTSLALTFKIDPAPLTVAWGEEDSFEYDGEVHCREAIVTGLVEADSDKYAVTVEGGPVKDAGEYTATFSLDEAIAANYTVSGETSADFEITKKQLTVKWDDVLEFTYDKTEHVPGAEVSGTVGEETVDYEVTVDSEDGKAVDAGEYTAKIVLADSVINYVIAEEDESVDFEITPAVIEIAWSDLEFTYDGEKHVPTAEATGLVEGDEVEVVVTGEQSDAGTHTATATLGESVTNYKLEGDESTTEFVINKKAASVTVDEGQTKVYGDVDPELTATEAGVVDGDELDYTVTRAEGENAGEYDITVTLGENPNYEITVTNGVFTITKKDATIAADDAEKVYGEDDPELTATETGIVEGDKLTYTVTRAEGEDAGEYDITVTMAPGSDTNYNLTVEGATFTINKKDAVITANAAEKVYGEDDPELTATEAGIVEGDELTYTVARAKGEDVGEYDITVTMDPGSDTNYNVTVEGATFTITKADPTFTEPKAKTGLTANGREQALIEAGSTEDGTMKYSLDGKAYDAKIPTGKDAKTYTVYWMVEGDKNHNDTEAKTLSVTIAQKSTPTPTPTPGGGGSTSKNYTVTIADTVNGGVTFVAPAASGKTAEAEPGTKVKVDVQPGQNYEVESVTYTSDVFDGSKDMKDEGNGIYSMDMIQGNVTIKATFKASESKVPSGEMGENEYVEGSKIIETATVEDDVAKADVSKAAVDKALENVPQNGTLTIEVVDTEDAESIELNIPKEAIDAINDKNASVNVQVETKKGDVILFPDVLEDVDGKDVKVGVTDNDDGSKTLTVDADGEPVNGLIKVILPAEADDKVLLKVNPDGSEEIVMLSYVEDGKCYAIIPAGATVRLSKDAGEFADVAPDAWYAKAVDFVSSHGLFQGTENGFEPSLQMTRAMMAMVLYRMSGETFNGVASFPDVPADAWYAEAVAWASAAGVVTGTDVGFEPNKNVTREQIATMLYRYAKYIGLSVSGESDLASFPDGASVSGWAQDAMKWAISIGLFQGDDTGALNPKNDATRAEVAALMMRFVKYLVK